MHRILPLLAAASFVAPAAAQPVLGSQEQFKLTSAAPYGAVVANGVYVGPYQAQVLSAPGMPMVDVFCVDYLNSIRVGDIWTANVSNLSSDLSGTRFGWNDPGAQVRYLQAAWLASQFRTTDKSQWGNIHAAMWNIMTPGSPTWGGDATNSWYQQATLANNWQSVDASQWAVVTDVNTVNGIGGKQEYLTMVTPEPGTMILLGSGLAGLGYLGRRRRRDGDA